MKSLASLGQTVALPKPPRGWHDYGYAVLADGALAVLRADRDIRAEYRDWQERVERTVAPLPPGAVIRAERIIDPDRFRDLLDPVRRDTAPSLDRRPDLWSGRARLSVFDGESEGPAIELPMVFDPVVGRLAKGNWLVVSTRTLESEVNAQVFLPDGTRVGGFPVGDAVGHLRCAPDGSIWVGRFDEARDPDIVRFRSDGTRAWRYNDTGSGPFSMDCYAMTLSKGTLWACCYPDFPIVRIEGDQVRWWANDLAGASALAVRGEHVALLGGYNDQSGRVALLKLGERADLVAEASFEPPSPGSLVQGHEDILHIVEAGSWTRVNTGTLEEALRLGGVGR
jgi:hypothetical protein